MERRSKAPGIFVPDECADDVVTLDLDRLYALGIRGIVLDLDNTIVRWGTDEISDELRGFVERARNTGIALCILSNNVRERSRAIAEKLGVKAIGNALKPSRRGYKKAIAAMGLSPNEVAVVGDQLFTDVLGGKRAGAYVILVKPMWEREHLYTRLVRRLERVCLRRMARTGKIKANWLLDAAGKRNR